MSIWIPSFEHKPHPSYDQKQPREGEYPARGHVHTSEGPGLNVMDVAWGATPYHVVLEVKKRRAIQVLDLALTGASLFNPGYVETNHMGEYCVGVCIHDVIAENMDTLTEADLEWLALEVFYPISVACGIPNLWLPSLDTDEAGFIIASASAPQRLSIQEWRYFHGWCGHQHVPGNDHWDPGDFKTEKVQEIMGVVDDVQRLESRVAALSSAVVQLGEQLADTAKVAARAKAVNDSQRERLNNQSERIRVLEGG